MKKNIIIITDYAAPYEGNFIASIKALEKVVVENGWKISYLFSVRTLEINWVKEFAKNHNVKYFENKINDIHKKINECIDTNYENIIYSHFARHKTQLAIKLYRMTHSKIKLVQHFHNHCKIPNTFPKKQLMSIAYKLYEGDLNIGCSESVMNSMPYKINKNTYVNNAIDFSRLDLNIKSNIIKKENNEIVILMFGFDYYRKGVDIAINALKDIAEKENIILVISLASNKEKVENKIKEIFGEIPEWICLLPPSENVSEYYNMADIFLSAAREEGFCYSLVEAIYCGCKCISSRISGVPNQIPGVITFENENVDELKEKIVYTIYDYQNNIDETKKYIVNKYDLSVWANEIMNKLDKI